MQKKPPNPTHIRTGPNDAHPNLKEEIRHLAFELYVERGRTDGHDVDDWLHAEAEVKGTAVKAAAV